MLNNGRSILNHTYKRTRFLKSPQANNVNASFKITSNNLEYLNIKRVFVKNLSKELLEKILEFADMLIFDEYFFIALKYDKSLAHAPFCIYAAKHKVRQDNVVIKEIAKKLGLPVFRDSIVKTLCFQWFGNNIISEYKYTLFGNILTTSLKDGIANTFWTNSFHIPFIIISPNLYDPIARILAWAYAENDFIRCSNSIIDIHTRLFMENKRRYKR